MRGKLTPRGLAIVYAVVAGLMTMNLLLCFWDVSERRFRHELPLVQIVLFAVALVASLACLVFWLRRSRGHGGRTGGEETP